MRICVGSPHRVCWLSITVWTCLATTAWGQEPSAPATSSPPAPTIEERLRALEETNKALAEQNRRLAGRLDRVSEQYGKVNQQLRSLTKEMDGSVVRARQAPSSRPPRSDASSEGGAGARDNPADMSTDAGPARVLDLGDDGDAFQPPRSDRSDEGGAGARDNPAEYSRNTPFTGPSRIPLRVNFGPGIEFETENEEYRFQIHDQLQLEARFYQQQNQNPAAGGFYVPRERFIIAGRLTKPIEYDASFESSYGNLNVLDAFMNFHYDDRVMLKFGRFKVPYLYEHYAISNTDLLQPELSVYGANFGLGRQAGAQLWGQLLDRRVDYAVGAFDGSRNQQVDFNSAKDVIAYVNGRPFFENEAVPALKWLNLGGSFSFGNQDNPVFPTSLKTSINATNNPGANNGAPSFFQWNNNVIERGNRTLWALNAAYYYKSLSLIAEYQGGNVDYALATSPNLQNTRVPLGGFYAAGGYFLTGETVNRRSQVRPIRPFDLRKKKFGLGAWELEARYSLLTMGDQVFTAGLADPNLWTNRVQTIDLGLNWYLNEYVKIYLDWQRAEFGAPVLYAPGKLQKNSDLFWIRGQIYF